MPNAVSRGKNCTYKEMREESVIMWQMQQMQQMIQLIQRKHTHTRTLHNQFKAVFESRIAKDAVPDPLRRVDSI